jgi:hypothetical protein
MKSLFTKLIIAIFAFLFGLMCWSLLKIENRKDSTSESPENTVRSVIDHHEIIEPKSSYEKVIYTCRVGAEAIPALQIAEVRDTNGSILGVVAHLTEPREIHFMVGGAIPHWDSSAVSARSENGKIEISYQPKGQPDGFNWILSLQGKERNLKQKVKDCSEVSDE